MKTLAIIIPAFSDRFLKKTLQSLADQTCKDFIVYIGDDNSPNDLYSIIKPFEKLLDIVYKRFESNFGGRDLVAQWERCIKLTKEPWLWLFSDDDLLGPRCIELFYEKLKSNKNIDLFHFDLKIIDKNGTVILDPQNFPENMSVDNFFTNRIKYRIKSTVVEYIFNREVYLLNGGFQSFDLAWGSDDATWIKLGLKNGIETITGDYVYWRYSGFNISSRTSDAELVYRKITATTNYIQWSSEYFNDYNLMEKSSQWDKVKWMLGPLLETHAIPYSKKVDAMVKMLKDCEFEDSILKAKCYLALWPFKIKFDKLINNGI